jgi:hypothetical protein
VEKYNTARQATGDNVTRRMRFACQITKVTDTHSEYVILIPFPRQQWLRERASLLRFSVYCLSCPEIHTKHINTLCGQNVEFVNVKPGGACSDH